MTVVIPTDRPKSVGNRCVIEVLGCVLCCPLVFEFSVGIRVFVIGLSHILFLFRSKLEYLFTSHDFKICTCTQLHFHWRESGNLSRVTVITSNNVTKQLKCD